MSELCTLIFAILFLTAVIALLVVETGRESAERKTREQQLRIESLRETNKALHARCAHYEGRR